MKHSPDLSCGSLVCVCACSCSHACIQVQEIQKDNLGLNLNTVSSWVEDLYKSASQMPLTSDF